MIKKNNKGFMLMETLLVSVFVASTLIFLFIQFQKVRNSYQTSFTYNTITGTYASSTFLGYLQDNGIENLSQTVASGTVSIDLTDCPGSYLSNTNLCKKLITNLGINKIYYTASDTSDFITRTSGSADLSPKFKGFLKSIKVTNRLSYRLLIEYKDETYSTILARKNVVDEKLMYKIDFSCLNCTINGTPFEWVAASEKIKMDVTVVPAAGYNDCVWSPVNPKGLIPNMNSTFMALCSAVPVTPPL